MKTFIYAAPASRVIFGAGTLARLEEEAGALDIARALIISTPEQTAQAAAAGEALGDRAAETFSGAVMHTPAAVTDQAMARTVDARIDGFVSIGGGSTIGLGKALALRTGKPHIAVPTTYAGSEMTPLLGETVDGAKTVIKDFKVLPTTVIYDVNLTLSLPPRMSCVSGLNAIAHAVEALYAPQADPILLLMAEEGIRALYIGLPKIAAAPQDAAARADALYGAWLCGVCLGRGSMALHHKLCHVLGGTFNLPHAETHAIILPHALAYNARAIGPTMIRIKRALGQDDPAIAFYDLTAAYGAPTALKDLGMPEAGIDQAVALVMKNPYDNPRALSAGGIRNLLRNAWIGARPSPALYEEAA